MLTLSSRFCCLYAHRSSLFHAIPMLLAVAAAVASDTAKAKTPGETYCFHGTCHRVKSIAETEALVGAQETLSTSFYDACEKDPMNSCGLTSSGAVFRPDVADNAASPIYPDGTRLLVWSPETREAAVLRVNNAGPYWGERKLDVSRAAAERLGFMERGVTDLEVRVIDAPENADATYKAGRTYDPVPGYLGRYESIEAAHSAMAAAMGLEAMAASLLAPLSGSAVAAARAELTRSPSATAVAAAPATKIDDKPLTQVAQAAPVEGTRVPTEAPQAAPAPDEKQVAQQSPARRTRAAAKSIPPRAERSAANKKASRTAKRSKGTAVASARPSKPARPTAIAPNDMSMFSRYASYRVAETHEPSVKTQRSRPRTASRPDRGSSRHT